MNIMKTRKTPAKKTLPKEVAEALEEIILFHWEAELENFIADEPSPDEEHIFRHLVTVDGWLEGYQATAEAVVANFTDDRDRQAAKARVRSFRGE